MMLRIVALVCVSIMALIVTPTITIANEKPSKPAMVIRFNQDIMSYEAALKKVVRTALTIKPDTFFDVVAVTSDSSTQGEPYTNQVIKGLKRYGVRQERIRLTQQDTAQNAHEEVHIFVR